MPPWIIDSVLVTAIANALSLDDPSTIAPRWQGIATSANLEAQAELLRFLQAAGYSPTQISSWDIGPCQAANTRMGLFFGLQSGAPLVFTPDKVKGFDVREDWRKIPNGAILQIGGVAVAPTPGGSQVGGIAFGDNVHQARLSHQYDRRFGQRQGWPW